MKLFNLLLYLFFVFILFVSVRITATQEQKRKAYHGQQVIDDLIASCDNGNGKIESCLNLNSRIKDFNFKVIPILIDDKKRGNILKRICERGSEEGCMQYASPFAARNDINEAHTIFSRLCSQSKKMDIKKRACIAKESIEKNFSKNLKKN